MRAFRSLSRFAVLAVVAFAIAVPGVVADSWNRSIDACVGYGQIAYQWLTAHVVRAASLAPKPTGTQLQPQRMLIAAGMYRTEREHRQTPTVTASWRMCPSI